MTHTCSWSGSPGNFKLYIMHLYGGLPLPLPSLLVGLGEYRGWHRKYLCQVSKREGAWWWVQLWIAMDTYAPFLWLTFCLAPPPQVHLLAMSLNSYFVKISQFVTPVQPLLLHFFSLFLSHSYCAFRIILKCMKNGLTLITETCFYVH